VGDWTIRDFPVRTGYVGSVAVHAPDVHVIRYEVDLGDLLSAAGPPAFDDVPDERRTTVSEGRLKVFCLPHAGGNAQHFLLWRRALPESVEVVPVDLPGHGTRLGEPLVDEWDELVADLVAVIGSRVGGPYAILGHSLGALLAFEVARTLERRGTPPELLVAVGRNAPAAPLSHPPIHALPDLPFFGALRRLGGLPDGVLRQPELLRMFLPALRTDLRLAEHYTRAPGPGLSCPVLAVSGQDDRMTDAAGMADWSAETTGECEVVRVPGDHFPLQREEFLDVLRTRLAAPVRGAR
ncbi:MAG: alpha/beta fold hydrolase, partial [Umezawaea sp.]